MGQRAHQNPSATATDTDRYFHVNIEMLLVLSYTFVEHFFELIAM